MYNTFTVTFMYDRTSRFLGWSGCPDPSLSSIFFNMKLLIHVWSLIVWPLPWSYICPCWPICYTYTFHALLYARFRKSWRIISFSFCSKIADITWITVHKPVNILYTLMGTAVNNCTLKFCFQAWMLEFHVNLHPLVTYQYSDINTSLSMFFCAQHNGG